MKKIHIGLLPRIVIAIAAGIAFGNVLPMMLIRAVVTVNASFSEFLNFSIPLIIVGLVTVAIANIGKGAGKMLLATVLIAYGATLFAGFLSYFTGTTFFPSLIQQDVPLEQVSEAQGILQSILGFGESEQALMIALYIAMDSFGTACNVTGDGAIALVIDKIYTKRQARRNKQELVA